MSMDSVRTLDIDIEGDIKGDVDVDVTKAGDKDEYTPLDFLVHSVIKTFFALCVWNVVKLFIEGLAGVTGIDVAYMYFTIPVVIVFALYDWVR